MKIDITYNGSLLDGVSERIKNGILNGAYLVSETAKSLCPVDTGELRDSISVSSDGNIATVSTNTDYAAFVEFGTSKMSPQAYLVPSLISNGQAVVSLIADSIVG